MTALLTPTLWCFLIVWLLWRMEIMVRYILDHNRHQLVTREWQAGVVECLNHVPVVRQKVTGLELELGELRALIEMAKNSKPDKELVILTERLAKLEQTVAMLALGS